MDALLNSFFLVLVSEMGDKTQLLALVLTLRYKKPFVILAGILVATLINHGLASWFGGFLSSLISPQSMKWILATLFFGFAAWILIPDKEEELKQENKFGAFLTTTITFFLAEMGDKTQLATVALGAEFMKPLLVTIGTTLGMMVADGLAVFFGEKLTQKISMKTVRFIACVSFVAFGIYILVK